MSHEDKGSFAFQMAHSPQHTQWSCEITLDEAKKKLELFEKSFPKLYDCWVKNQVHSIHDTLIVRTKDQAEAKQLCIDLLQELQERYLTLLDWDSSSKESEEFYNRVKEALSTGDREARCRPAKPVDVGSNPTSCSRLFDIDGEPIVTSSPNKMFDELKEFCKDKDIRLL